MYRRLPSILVLAALLERLERHLAATDGVHDQLMELGPPELDTRQTRRLIRELIAAGGSLLDARHNYLVGARLRWAAKQARVLPDDALIDPEYERGGSFRVTTRRHGEHPFSSMDVQRRADAALVERYGAPVDLTGFDLEVRAG